MLADIFSILFELGWTTMEMEEFDLLLLGMSEARSGNPWELGKAVPIPKRETRETSTGKHHIDEIPNMLRKAGWTRPEAMAALLFIRRVQRVGTRGAKHAKH